MDVLGAELKNQFISKMKEMADVRYSESIPIIQEEYLTKIKETETELLQCLEEALKKYHLLRKRSETGSLASVFISFMRTSVLYDVTHYRIDLYDAGERCSLTECAVGWNFTLVFRHFEQIKSELAKESGSQTKVKEYELDKILYELGGRFMRLAEKMIPEIIEKIIPDLEKHTEFSGRICFYLGEYLDKSEMILKYDDSKIGCQDDSSAGHTKSRELQCTGAEEIS